MCVNEFSNYSDQEKIDLLKDYIDYLNTWECVNYDLFCKIENNNKLKKTFLREVVPLGFDELDINNIFSKDWSIYEICQQNLHNLAFEYPRFYYMIVIAWLLYCYNEKSLSIKKLLSRWSKIMLNY